MDFLKLRGIYNLNIFSHMRRGERKAEEKNINYKNLISQYYDKDHHLNDVKPIVRTVTPEIEIMNELNEFEKKIDTLIKW